MARAGAAPVESGHTLECHTLECWKHGAYVESIDLPRKPKQWLVGRDADKCDVVLDHPSCSRTHARLETEADGSLWLTDLGSAQGTFVDGARLSAHQRRSLVDAERITFGSSTRSYHNDAPLTADAKKQLLWGPKRHKPAASAQAQAREAANLERWGAAAAALGEDPRDEGGRSKKFLALTGAAKYVSADVTTDAAKAAAKTQADLFDELERNKWGQLRSR
ncbi:SMAD/FHA domain-containing protein [Pelagophyceae sp. CCMP2097]|nr:SMAD/FHA domain-containing protein [Pelagophyceae sp. CCMP2097]